MSASTTLATSAERYVVIAHADLLCGDRIVFIDDGKDTLLDERCERTAGIEITAAVCEVGAR